MNDHSIQCVVVTPERAILDETVDTVVVPMYDGELGVLPGRAPLIGRLGYGELRTTKSSTVKRYFVDGGFVQVRDNVVTVLTERAKREEELSVEQANADLAAALQPGDSPDAQEAQQAKQQRARAMLRVAKKRVSEI